MTTSSGSAVSTGAHARVCDCFPELKEVTLDREKRYREDPRKAAPEGPRSTVEVRVESVGELNERASSLKSGRSWTISEPAHVGGRADAPTPLEYLLSGALGCFAAVFAFYAAKHDVPYDTFEVDAVAEFDARGHMMTDAPPSGFSTVTLKIRITGGDRRDLEQVLEAALQGCPGIRTLKDPVQFDVELQTS